MPSAAASSSTVDAATATRIAELLATANAHMESLHLTTPQGDNAFEDFNAVLRLQADNAEAKAGITEISNRYVELADGAMTRGEYVAARRYLELAQTVDPSNSAVQARRDELRNRRQSSRAQAREPPPAEDVLAEGAVAENGSGVIDRVSGFLQPDPGERPPDSRSEELRARLGGSH